MRPMNGKDMTRIWVNQLKICPDKKPTYAFQLWRALGKDLEEQYDMEDPQAFKQAQRISFIFARIFSQK